MFTLFLLCCLGGRGNSVHCWYNSAWDAEPSFYWHWIGLLSRVWWDTCIAWSLSLHVLCSVTVSWLFSEGMALGGSVLCRFRGRWLVLAAVGQIIYSFCSAVLFWCWFVRSRRCWPGVRAAMFHCPVFAVPRWLDIFIRCCFDVGSPSWTVGQHWSGIGSMTLVFCVCGTCGELKAPPISGTVPTLDLCGSSIVFPGLLGGHGENYLPVGTVGSYLRLYNSGRYDPWVP